MDTINTEELRKSWLSFITSNRHSGEIELLKQAAKLNDRAIVVCYSSYIRNILQKDLPDNLVISVTDVEEIMGMRRPMLFDQDAIAFLLN